MLTMVHYAPGTILARPKGPFTHWGIVTEFGTVFHNTPERGEHESSVSEFSGANPVSAPYRVADLHPFLTRLRERRAHPHAYDAASWNCEDTVAYLAGEWPRLRQVLGVLLTFAAIVVIAIAARDAA